MILCLSIKSRNQTWEKIYNISLRLGSLARGSPAARMWCCNLTWFLAFFSSFSLENCPGFTHGDCNSSSHSLSQWQSPSCLVPTVLEITGLLSLLLPVLLGIMCSSGILWWPHRSHSANASDSEPKKIVEAWNYEPIDQRSETWHFPLVPSSLSCFYQK